MQLIRDNLTLWTSELQNDDEGGDAQVENIWKNKNNNNTWYIYANIYPTYL